MPAHHVETAPGLFGPLPGVEPWLNKDESLLIRCEDPEAAAHAPARAAPRLMSIAENGQAFLTDEEASQNYSRPDSLHTPSCISPVYRNPQGPWIHIDADGFISPPMGQAIVTLVREELLAAGITQACLVPAPWPRPSRDVWIDIDWSGLR
ncbi:hypothetical protein FHR75_004076 [Kineococcus radiotolerans]|uniref:Uncharacterized protein n=1 Tax=Kineococcus radiotolerans TaxID=131568 RepID=A0A7W4TQL3_KINRA|nr:hypothetical protein [Kineococcus radiotolerans]MBB2903234.1 hypothetical protein [Kineococcus radiotolerans]